MARLPTADVKPEQAVDEQCMRCVWLVPGRPPWCRVFTGPTRQLPPAAFRRPDGICSARETDLHAFKAWREAERNPPGDEREPS